MPEDDMIKKSCCGAAFGHSSGCPNRGKYEEQRARDVLLRETTAEAGRSAQLLAAARSIELEPEHFNGFRITIYKNLVGSNYFAAPTNSLDVLAVGDTALECFTKLKEKLK